MTRAREQGDERGDFLLVTGPFLSPWLGLCRFSPLSLPSHHALSPPQPCRNPHIPTPANTALPGGPAHKLLRPSSKTQGPGPRQPSGCLS